MFLVILNAVWNSKCFYFIMLGVVKGTTLLKNVREGTSAVPVIELEILKGSFGIMD